MLSYETIEKDALWVAKMNGYRQVGTYDEIEIYSKSEECRDFDLICSDGQPEHLRKFFKDYEEQPDDNHIYFLSNFYDLWIKNQ